MVVIINGEIVADNDPRAQAMRRTGTAPRGPTQQQQDQRGSAGGFGTVHSSSSGSDAGVGGGNASGPDGPFTPISRMLGIEGRVVTIPAMLGMQEQRIPLVVPLIAAGVTLMAGPRFGAAFLLLTWVYLQNQQQSE